MSSSCGMLRRSCLRLRPTPAGHIYELRTYEVAPSNYDAFHQISSRMMPQRPQAGRCLGYWTGQMGALNQFVQIWEFNNLQHRYECRKLLEQDQEWARSYLKSTSSMMQNQSNVLMRMVYREGNASTMSYKYLMQSSPHKEIALSGPSAILAATFQVVIGDEEGKYVHLVKGKYLDDVIPQHPSVGCSSKILGPARWSNSLGATWR